VCSSDLLSVGCVFELFVAELTDCQLMSACVGTNFSDHGFLQFNVWFRASTLAFKSKVAAVNCVLTK
jgi:hypothetical protein